MKTQITAFFMAWGSYCSIPCPKKIWAEEASVWTPVYLPVIGLLIGAIWMLIIWAVHALQLPRFLSAALGTVAPFLLSGFFHLDGFMDCCDAILSRRDLPRRQEILKDSHVGSFAVICVALLFLTEFAVFCDLDAMTRLGAFLLLPASVRCASALAIEKLPPMKTSQFACGFAANKAKAQVLWLLLVFAAVMGSALLLSEEAALACGVGAFCAGMCAIANAKQLGGMNGDCAGCAVTVGELAGLLSLLI